MPTGIEATIKGCDMNILLEVLEKMGIHLEANGEVRMYWTATDYEGFAESVAGEPNMEWSDDLQDYVEVKRRHGSEWVKKFGEGREVKGKNGSRAQIPVDYIFKVRSEGYDIENIGFKVNPDGTISIFGGDDAWNHAQKLKDALKTAIPEALKVGVNETTQVITHTVKQMGLDTRSEIFDETTQRINDKRTKHIYKERHFIDASDLEGISEDDWARMFEKSENVLKNRGVLR